jgi:osmotically-inducible protein OsmY
MRNVFKLTTGSAFILLLGASPIARAESAGQYIDDATITTKVKVALLSDSQLTATKVSVETNHGAVRLSGTVDTKDQESEAVKVANQVNGVKSVHDLLTVRGTQDE